MPALAGLMLGFSKSTAFQNQGQSREFMKWAKSNQISLSDPGS